MCTFRPDSHPRVFSADILLSPDLHLSNAECRGGEAPVQVQVIADPVDPGKHFKGRTSDCQTLDRKGDAAVLYPETAGAA